MKKFIIAFSVTTFIISFLLLGFFFVGPKIFKVDNVTLPDCLGKTQEEALKLLEGLNISVTFQEIESEENGIVVDMVPKANTIVKKNSEAVLYLGVKLIKMPSLVNRYYDDVKSLVTSIKEKSNNEIILIDIVDNELPINYVKKQIPLENELIDEKTTIVIYRVIHDNIVILPNMVGWTYDMVIDFQNKKDIYFDFVYDYSFDVSENRVISQSAKPGSEIIKNGKNFVTVVISKGIEEVPDFEGLDIAVAEGVAKFLNIDYEINYVLSNAPINTVISQELYVSTIEKVILYVSR